MITIQTLHSIKCAYVAGRLDTITSGEFDAAIKPLLQTEKVLIIDLSGCPYLSSFGIRSLLNALKIMKSREGGQLILCGLQAGVFQVLEMAGLDALFTLQGSAEEAALYLVGSQQEVHAGSERQIGTWRFLYQHAGLPGNTLLRWRDQGIAGYDELRIAVGRGVSAEMAANSAETGALFVSTGSAAAFVPYNKDLPADFRVTTQPAQAGIFVEEAVSTKGAPALQLKLATAGRISQAELLDSLQQLMSQDHPDVPLILAIVIDQSIESPAVTIGVQTLSPYHRGPEKNKMAFLTQGCENENGAGFAGLSFVLNTLGDLQQLHTLDDILTGVLSFDNIVDIKSVSCSDIKQMNIEDTFTDPLVWIYLSDNLEDASGQRIQIHAGDEFLAHPHNAFLLRRLYIDSGRVELQQLQGGFSAQTFQVTSYDKQGRRLRPTVMKIADRAMITRESSRCKQYAMPYILNNSAMVLGAEFLGEVGALRYNFVGIGGEQSRLKWLTHYYKAWPLEKLGPLFDKIFMQILHPWYGQSLNKSIQAFLDHDPTRTFFPHVFDEAKTVLHIDADEPTIKLAETGESLLNPYWFLKHEYPRRLSWTMDYPTSICHGDLNMQNILLDDDMNVYLIDFSETKPRAVVSDFARLEAIFLHEHTTLQDESDFLRMIEFVKCLYSTDRLDQHPTLQVGVDEQTRKSFSMIMRMRQYSLQSAGGDSSMVTYYIALLEWVLPIVCYYSVTHKVKRLSMIAAAKICEKLMQLLPEQA